ncbi:hypothetical protein AOC36_09120 [Erysipelothrix larvae]|uniref:Lipoprotein n=1 Tax=Erysipelothrix larvae TaxID=1514105 RepID=A0A120JTW2_9FIRM|nr:hypothetical protein [Erysipelothrix larvae]AMC94143.1 hypothetical protein AOC36_09120 [Erysipelothrix larvae]
MKKYLSILVVLFALVACGNSGDSEKPDANSTASVTNDATVVKKSLSAEGNWITAITADVTFTDELVVDGTFHQSNEESKDIYRKLALHTQDDAYNVIDNFTLTTPKLVVNSENFTIFYGTVKGDIYVNADGFALYGTKVDGNIVFASDAYKASSDLDKESKGAEVTGDITVE